MPEEGIRLYPSNWLMAAGIVGFVKIFGDSYIKGDCIEISEAFIKKTFPEEFSNFLSRQKNVYNIIGDFYNNSPFAQIWQKSIKDTLIQLGIPKNKAEEYEIYTSPKKSNNQNFFLKKINSILTKLKKPELHYQKFLYEDDVDKALYIFKKYKNLIPKVEELSKTKKLKELPKELESDFNQLIKDLRSILEKNEVLKQQIKKVVDKLIVESNETDYICSFCSERRSIYRIDKKNKPIPIVLDEPHFTPLGSSPSNLANLYWEGKPANFLCLPCELIIYCAAFGFTKVAGKRYIFINAPTTIKEIVGINNIWGELVKQGTNFFKESLIEILKTMEEAKATWTLQNISFIELTKCSENTFNIYSFNIPVGVAKAVRKMIQSYPYDLQDIYDIFVDYIYSGKSLYDMTGDIIYGLLNKEKLQNISSETVIERLLLTGKNIKNPKDLLFFLKFQKEVEDYEH